MNSLSPPTSVSCPKCGRPSTRTFDMTGVCVRCAGAQIFTHTIADRPGSTPPMPIDTAAGPMRIGPYAIISELGRGGMGVVYLAQHSQLGRIVALKVLPSRGSATSDLEMRFLREAGTVARLSHPHIVTVHDAGRDRGHAYFSMDYFEEGDLARRLRTQAFAPREAATLLRSVADAIACSHAAGVLHRDLKPSNILLSAGEPSVGDFGLATELDSSAGLTARTAVLGTPHYLAPEALSRGSAALGVASDIYALGVILHEMLTGRTPFAGASPAELPGLLAQNDAPNLRLLAPQVPQDLATICGKCLEVDPARRYATAAALAKDLGHFLGGEPIEARPVSAVSQLLRWARRRPALAATWLLSFSLAAASLTIAVLIDRERVRADNEVVASKALAEFLGRDVLGQAAPSAEGEPDRDLKLRTALDRAMKQIPLRFAAAPLAEADLRLILGGTYSSLGESPEAERQFRRAAALRQQHLGAKHKETLQAFIELAQALSALGRDAEAAPLIRSTTLELVRSVGEQHPYSIGAMETESMIERRLGNMPRALLLSRKAMLLSRRALPPDHELTRNALENHATLLFAQGKMEEGATLMRALVAAQERALGPRHYQTLGARVSLATIEADRGHAAEAEVTLRELHRTILEILGPNHPETLRALGNLAGILSKLEKHQEAHPILSELVAARRRVSGPEHAATLLAMKNLALNTGRVGDLDGALALMRELIELSARSLGPDHMTTVNNRRNYAAMLVSAGRHEEALEVARTAYATSLHNLGPEDLSTLSDAEVIGSALMSLRRYEEVIEVLRPTFEALQRTLPDHWRTHVVHGQLGRALALSGQVAESEPILRESHAALLARQAVTPASRRTFHRLVSEQLAAVCAATGRPEEAAEWRRKSEPAGTGAR